MHIGDAASSSRSLTDATAICAELERKHRERAPPAARQGATPDLTSALPDPSPWRDSAGWAILRVMGVSAWLFLRPRPGELHPLAQRTAGAFIFKGGRIPADAEGFVEKTKQSPRSERKRTSC